VRGGDAVDADGALTRTPEADGEMVWFRHPKGWCQVRSSWPRATVARAQGSPRRSPISR